MTALAGVTRKLFVGLLGSNLSDAPIVVDLYYRDDVEQKNTADFQLTGALKRSAFGIGQNPATWNRDEVAIASAASSSDTSAHRARPDLQ